MLLEQLILAFEIWLIRRFTRQSIFGIRRVGSIPQTRQSERTLIAGFSTGLPKQTHAEFWS